MTPVHEPLELVTREWPRGWCPEHVFTQERCTRWCTPTRQAFGQAARDLEAYWPIWEAKMARKPAA